MVTVPEGTSVLYAAKSVSKSDYDYYCGTILSVGRLLLLLYSVMIFRSPGNSGRSSTIPLHRIASYVVMQLPACGSKTEVDCFFGGIVCADLGSSWILLLRTTIFVLSPQWYSSTDGRDMGSILLTHKLARGFEK